MESIVSSLIEGFVLGFGIAFGGFTTVFLLMVIEGVWNKLTGEKGGCVI